MKRINTAIRLFILLTLLTGCIYPFLITGFAKIVFPEKSAGSILRIHQKAIGSALIGQAFNNPAYFSSRPSSTDYKTLPSSGSNLGLTNQKLYQLTTLRTNQFRNLNGLDSTTLIPSEMIFASASGLDPHISPQAALLQVERIARIRKLNTTQKKDLYAMVRNNTENPQFGIFGEPRVNVLVLNLSLDQRFLKNGH